MSTEKDFYKILGVDKNADIDTIKKAYKKLALKWHPDRFANATEKEQKKAEETFKEISEAYDVLSNSEKRQQYDNGGMDFNFEDIFSHFGGGFGSFFGGGQRGRRVNKGSNVKAYVFMTLKEAFTGAKKQVNVTRNIPCDKCNGTGSADGTSPICPHCNGSGMISESRQMGPGSFSMTQRPCPHCQGSGKIIKTPCNHCHGNGFQTETVIETYDIPKGVVNGLTLNVQGAGNAPVGENGVNGDLYLEIVIKEDNYFTRPDEVNLIHYAEVPFNECILGFEKEFEAIDGTKVKVKAPELTPHGKSFIFKGKGMPHYNNPNIVGDYAVVINYKYPTSLTKEQRKKLKDF